METIKIKHETELPKNYTGIVDFIRSGHKFWYKEGKLHRLDGPACEYSDGIKQWWVEGKRHRTNGPAIEYLGGLRSWYVNEIQYRDRNLQILIKTSIYLGKEKGKYNIEWLRFLTEKSIEEFPIILGMEKDKGFKFLFDKLFEAPKP